MPGEFYKRELPCLLQVYAQIKEIINIIIIDGYVMLGKERKGLGGYLYEALDKKIPIIGVAKTFFKNCVHYTEVYRGKSTRPLYVSSIGLDLDFSAALICNLEGPYRIPTVLKAVDRLTRLGQGGTGGDRGTGPLSHQIMEVLAALCKSR